MNENQHEDAHPSSRQSERIERRFTAIDSWQTFLVALSTMAILWFSFPPVGVWWVAWVAPVPLIWLCGLKQMPGRHPYRAIGLAGFAYWLATFYFIPIPHWALWFGWLTVSAYLAIYTMLFVGVTRSLVHVYRIPLWIAAPIGWTGIEWIRCNVVTGMGMVCLSHSQYRQPMLIQVADIFGGYTLTFVMVLFSASVVGLPLFGSCCERNKGWVQPVVAVLSVGLVLVYGQYRLNEKDEVDDSRSFVAALIQGSVDTNLNDRESERTEKFEQCCQLTWQVRGQYKTLDLIVWPEANLPIFDVIPGTGPQPKWLEGYDPNRELKNVWQIATGFPEFFAEPANLIAGTLGSFDGDEAYNSAVLIDQHGDIAARYLKNHRVMFGEYFPILEWIPVFAKSFPSTAAGKSPQSFEVNQVVLAPNICFESTVPHLIRRHLNQLSEDGNEPDAMINLTNDGWFYGTSCLDFHLACNVFRAVEMRMTNLVCANTGFSAEIDSSGRILQQGPRRETGTLVVKVMGRKRASLYRAIGDWIPMSLAAICGLGLLGGLLHGRPRATAADHDTGVLASNNSIR